MSYQLIKRNSNSKGENMIFNTHTCVIDHDIIEITCYERKDNFFFLSLINLLTIGFINLTYIFKYDYFINFYYRICDIKFPQTTSRYILIKNQRGNSIFVDLKKNNYFLTFPELAKQNINIPLINEKLVLDNISKNAEKAKDILLNDGNIGYNIKAQRKRSKVYSLKEDMVYSFSYKNNKYEFDQVLNKFKPAFFYLGDKLNVEIHDQFGDGIKSLTEYNKALNRFGLNIIITLKSQFLDFFFNQISHPFYIYQLFALIIWGLNGYLSYLTIVAVLVVLVTFFNAYLSYINWRQVFSNEEIKKCQAVRNLSEYYLNEKIIYDGKFNNLKV